jgi:glycosyltransferase involved in cell wall biosynthesis
VSATTTKPLVSIVTPSFDQAEFLEETIVSILDNGYPALEYVVVDDGSTDASPEIIRCYENRLAWWTRQENAGQAASLNRGFERTTGRYLGFVSGDDTLLPGAIERLVDALEADPAAVLAYGDAYHTDERSERVGYAHSREWDTAWVLRTAKNPVVQPTALWTREAWERAGPLDEESEYYLDLELFLRLSIHGRFRRIPEPLATVRLHPRSQSVSGAARKARDAGRFADVVLNSPDWPPELRPHTRRARAAWLLRSGTNFYAALDLRAARRQLVRAFLAHPAVVSRRWATLLAKSLLPLGLVRRLRARRLVKLGIAS